jgi:hypothetical protein
MRVLAQDMAGVLRAAGLDPEHASEATRVGVLQDEFRGRVKRRSVEGIQLSPHVCREVLLPCRLSRQQQQDYSFLLTRYFNVLADPTPNGCAPSSPQQTHSWLSCPSHCTAIPHTGFFVQSLPFLARGSSLVSDNSNCRS